MGVVFGNKFVGLVELAYNGIKDNRLLTRTAQQQSYENKRVTNFWQKNEISG